MIDEIVFVMMLIVAIFIVSSRNYKRVIVAMSVFSLLAAFCYLLFHAPDVAIAEAVIGSALSTILYIVALKKHRNFYVYLTDASKTKTRDAHLRTSMKSTIETIMHYCHEQDLDAQNVFTSESPKEIAHEHVYDLILQKQEDGKIKVYGSKTEKHVQIIKDLLSDDIKSGKLEFFLSQKEGDE